MWKKHLGIDITLINQEWKVYLDNRDNKNYAIARAGWLGDYLDPNTFLEIFLSDSGNNRTGWSNSEYDTLINRANSTLDTNVRYDFFQQAEAILIDSAPIAPIYIESSVRLIHPTVKGVYTNNLAYYPFRHVYLESANDMLSIQEN